MEHYNDFYQRTFEHVIARYRDSYPVFGNSWVAVGLLTWDFYSNHTGVVLIFVKQRLTDLEFMAKADPYVTKLYQLNINMHKLFRDWHALEKKEREAGMPSTIPVMVEGLFGLVKEFPDDESLLDELRSNVRNSEAMAVAIFSWAVKALPDPFPTDRPLNPYVLSLDPAKWEADGLFDPEGMSIDEAKGIVRGIDGIWDPALALPGGPPPGVGGPGGPPPGMGGPGGPPPGMGGPGGPPPGMGGPGGPPPGVGGPPAGVGGPPAGVPRAG